MDENLIYILLLGNGFLLVSVVLILTFYPKNTKGQRMISKQKNCGKQETFESASIVEKLSSRKLWVALGAFITTMGVTWGFDDITTEQLTGTCVAISGLITYIGAEGYADGRSPTNKTDEIYQENREEITNDTK